MRARTLISAWLAARGAGGGGVPAGVAGLPATMLGSPALRRGICGDCGFGSWNDRLTSVSVVARSSASMSRRSCGVGAISAIVSVCVVGAVDPEEDESLLLDPIGVAVIARVDDDFSLSLVLADASDESVSCASGACAGAFGFFLCRPVSGLCFMLVNVGGLDPFSRRRASVAVSLDTIVCRFSAGAALTLLWEGASMASSGSESSMISIVSVDLRDDLDFVVAPRVLFL